MSESLIPIEPLPAQHALGYRCIGYRELLRQQQQFLHQVGQEAPMEGGSQS